MSQPVRWAWIVATAGVCGVLAGIELRHGIAPLMDSVSYLAGTEAARTGHWYSTFMTPSFSGVDPIAFLGRGGSAPFVDLAPGYPTIAGALAHALSISTDAATTACAVAAHCVIGATVSAGVTRRAGHLVMAVRLVLAASITLTPIMVVLTRGVMSEPLGVAVALVAFRLLVLALVDSRPRWHWVVLAAVAIAAGSWVRFANVGLVVPLVYVLIRVGFTLRTRIAALVIALVPFAANQVWAGANSGSHGHVFWRGVAWFDVRFAAQSFAGWLDHSAASPEKQYFSDSRLSAWLVVLAGVAALSLVGVTVSYLLAPRTRSVRAIGPAVGLAVLSAASVIGVVVVTALWLDSIVLLEHRQFIVPLGLLVCGVAWRIGAEASTAADVDGSSERSARRWILPVAVLVVTVWRIGPHPFGPQFEQTRSDWSEVIALHPRVVIADTADPIWFATRIPSTYLPVDTFAITERPRDTRRIYDRLPCALRRAKGIAVSNQRSWSVFGRANLDHAVDLGLLHRTEHTGYFTYEPTDSACSAPG